MGNELHPTTRLTGGIAGTIWWDGHQTVQITGNQRKENLVPDAAFAGRIGPRDHPRLQMVAHGLCLDRGRREPARRNGAQRSRSIRQGARRLPAPQP